MASALLDRRHRRFFSLGDADYLRYRVRSASSIRPGSLGLVEPSCAHRKASLAYGVPEPNGIRRLHGFDNVGFYLRGVRLGEECIARAGLPGYPISSIRTGQYVSGEGEIWRAEFAVGR